MKISIYIKKNILNQTNTTERMQHKKLLMIVSHRKADVIDLSECDVCLLYIWKNMEHITDMNMKKE